MIRHEPMSYFVKIETEAGERDIWGVDLKRALKESLTQPNIGDEIGLRAVRRDTVTVQEAEHDAEGKVVGQKPLDIHRNRWIVEKREFFAERAAAARTLRDPRLTPSRRRGATRNWWARICRCAPRSLPRASCETPRSGEILKPRALGARRCRRPRRVAAAGTP